MYTANKGASKLEGEPCTSTHNVCASDFESLKVTIVYLKKMYCVNKRQCIDVWNNAFVKYGIEMQKVGNMSSEIYIYYVRRTKNNEKIVGINPSHT